MANFVSFDGDTATLADLTGPGAVVRIWSANPTNGALKIYVDDNPVPVVNAPLNDVLNGNFTPFSPPLSRSSMGGHWTFLPIPYANHCRITVDSPGRLYYQVNSVRFPDNTPVRPFNLPLTAEDQAALAGASKSWTPPFATMSSNAEIRKVNPGTVASFTKVRGPGVIRQVVVNAADASDIELRRLVLHVTFDKHKTADIEAPISDFFGDAYGHAVFDSLVLSQTSTGDMICRLPMPFFKSAIFTVENGNSRPLNVSLGVVMQPGELDPSKFLYLHADFKQDLTLRGRPHAWLHVTGSSGRLVGIVQAMESPFSVNFLEGDDQIRVDDEMMKSCREKTTVVAPWNGTGTEDFFNSGWYFLNPLMAAPLNACLVKDNDGKVDAFRFLLNEAPVFQKSIDAQIEHGGKNDAPDGTYYSSVAYWYGAGERTALASMPPASSLTLPFSPTPRLELTGPGVFEAERTPVDITGGKVRSQMMAGFKGVWSRGYQQLWQGPQLGDTLTFHLKTDNAGNYDVTGYLTKAPNYGNVTFNINGQDMPKGFDGFAPNVAATGPTMLGTVSLPAGPVDLVVKMVGKDDQSTGSDFGIDAIVLKPNVGQGVVSGIPIPMTKDSSNKSGT